MSLRARISLSLLLMLAFSVALNFGMLRLVVQRSLGQLERDMAMRSLTRCTEAIHSEVRHLDTFVLDWANWDDTYAFVHGRGEEYAAANLLPQTFRNAGINLIYIVDSAGQVVWGQARDLSTGEEISLREFAGEAWPPTHPFLAGPAAGLFPTARDPLLIAARPILTSAGEGPSRGALIMGRFLDEASVQHLGEQTQTELSAWPVVRTARGLKLADQSLVEHDAAASQQAILDQLSSGEPIAMHEQSDALLWIYTLVPDIQGEPVLLLRAGMARPINVAGIVVGRYALLSIVAIGIVLTLLTLWLLQRGVTRPLTALTRHAAAVGQTGDLSARLELRRRDELGVLARAFDRMLAALQQSRAELQRANAALQAEVNERKRTEQRLERSLVELAVLFEASHAFSRLLSPEAVGQEIIATIERLMSWQRGSIWLRSDANNELRLLAHSHLGLPADALQAELAQVRGMVARLGDGISGWVALHGEAVRTGNVKADPRYIEADPRMQSELCVPLKVGGRVIGALNMESPQPDAFSEHDEQLSTIVAVSAAVAIENARLYQALQDHASRLEETVARRTAELMQREAALRAANEKLKELDRLKNQFVSNVSHELRTPLANIIAYLYLLEEGKPEKFKQYVATLNREANLLQQLIEDLLLLSRLDLDRAHPSLSVLDINEVVSRLANDRSLLIEKRGLSLQTELSPGRLLARADSKMLLQIITNLMTNAMNFTPAGGTITLTTGMRDGPPHVGQHAAVRSAPEGKNGHWAVVSVSDTGPGISPEDLAHLFERFYRGDAARQSSVPGTGLGLAICKELADRLDATVTVQSQVGQGSTFSVWLPVGEKPLS